MGQFPGDPPPPYRAIAPIARYIKAVMQMLVAIIAIVNLIDRAWPVPALENARQVQEDVFSIIGLALAVAAAIELAYTLFTHGPDEALDPLTLGLSAALILQLGKVEEFRWTEAFASLMYVLALAILFVVRKYLTENHQVEEWSLWRFLRVDIGRLKAWRKPSQQGSKEYE